jgi:hypothetical protein
MVYNKNAGIRSFGLKLVGSALIFLLKIFNEPFLILTITFFQIAI